VMSHVDKSSLEKGKTIIIQLKGVKITKQDFPLKVDVFQDSLLKVCLVTLFNMTLGLIYFKFLWLSRLIQFS
jgi:hypothetical protein